MKIDLLGYYSRKYLCEEISSVMNYMARLVGLAVSTT